MFKLILFLTIIYFVCVRSIDNRDTKYLSSLDGPRLDSTLDAGVTEADERLALQLSTTHATEDTLITNHETMHTGSKHPKKKAANLKDDRGTDLRPGCCG
ncbi:unnamed protein product [Xylocopa violacea]|uniref:Secreted protein n=1 Tax=Xylocopa violacea TaxID=135666 RepID=A0ABP1PDZ6_XYLVO